MTQTADHDVDASSASPSPSQRRLASSPSSPGICPYLLSVDGSWRSSSPARDHRCAAILPATPLAPDKQRRLCLTASHPSCATHAAALKAHPGSVRSDVAGAIQRPYPRTVPVVLDQGHLQVSVPVLSVGRGTGQVALVALMAVAFSVIAVSRLAGLGAGAAVSSPSPSVVPSATIAVAVSPSPTARPSAPTPTLTAAPTVVASATAAVTPEPTPVPATPVASAVLRSYTVQPGDTLIRIATRFGTTASVLMRLNGIDDARLLRIGAVLQIP